MSQAALNELEVMDLVPFGSPMGDMAFYALRLSPPAWEQWSPGQFVMLRPTVGGGERVWARPFSICRATNADLVLFFQVKGRGTKALTRLEPGDCVTVWGPLGNAFAVEPQTPTLLLAGGIGIAPFVGYVHTHPTPWDIKMEFSHRVPLDCYPIDSIMEKALVESHLEKTLEDRTAFLTKVEQRVKEYAPKGLILACGPTPFLREVQRCALRHKAKAQLCLETRMACGVGACLGCVVKAAIADGKAPAGALHNVQTCTCGPNFWAESVDF